MVDLDLRVFLIQGQRSQVEVVQKTTGGIVGQISQPVHERHGVFVDPGLRYQIPAGGVLRKRRAGVGVGNSGVEKAVPHVLGRAGGAVHLPSVLDGYLLAEKEEGPVAILQNAGNVDGATHRSTENILLLNRHRRRKEVARIEVVVPHVFEQRPVELLGTALGLEHDHGSAHDAVLGAVIVLQRAHFFETVGVRQHRGLSHISGVHIPHAVQRVIRAADAHSIDRHRIAGAESARTESVARLHVHHARHQNRKRLVISSIERQCFDLLLRHLVGNFARADLNLRRASLHGDLGRNRADLHGCVDGAHHRGPKKNARLRISLEAVFRDRDGVAAHRQARHGIAAVRVGVCLRTDPGLFIRHDDLGAGHDRARVVGEGAVNGGGGRLSERDAHAHENQRAENQTQHGGNVSAHITTSTSTELYTIDASLQRNTLGGLFAI